MTRERNTRRRLPEASAIAAGTAVGDPASIVFLDPRAAGGAPSGA